MKAWLTYLIFSLALLSCTEYEPIKLNFYLNTTDSMIVYKTFDVDGGEVYHPAPINLKIESAKDFGEWLIDSHSVFAWYNTSEGRFLRYMEVADRSTFTPFDSSIYSKDKLHVYDTRHGIIAQADAETFEAIKIEVDGRVAYGKDRNHYFFWDEIVSDTMGFTEAYRKRKMEEIAP